MHIGRWRLHDDGAAYAATLIDDALALSLAFGWVQQMRGAHFLSHTLWSIWLSWTIVVGLHAILGLWRQPLPESVRSPQVASRTEEPTLRSAA